MLEDDEEEEEEEEKDDEDVWALRAQALKSLACKRAVRAKEINKKKRKAQEPENIPSPPMEAAVATKPESTVHTAPETSKYSPVESVSLVQAVKPPNPYLAELERKRERETRTTAVSNSGPSTHQLKTIATSLRDNTYTFSPPTSPVPSVRGMPTTKPPSRYIIVFSLVIDHLI